MSTMRTQSTSAKEATGTTLTIRGHEIPVTTRLLDQASLRFFPENPRIYSLIRADGRDPSQDEIQERLLEMEHVRFLISDIKQNGGLTDPIIVLEDSSKVIEGNSRLAAYRHLAKLDPVKWSKVKCTLLPAGIEEGQIFALLGQYHIKGKKDWAPYEQAGFLYRRFKHQQVDLKTLAEEIGLSVRKVEHLINTYQFMIDHKERDTDRWSYYDEYLKSPKIKKARKTYSQFDDLVVEKIKSGEIERAVDVRGQLPLICATSPKALKKFIDGSLTFPEAYESAREGGGDSSHLKKLTAFRKWVASDKAEAMVRASGQTRSKIGFELAKIHARVTSLRNRLKGKP